jgi:hypothetical protein
VLAALALESTAGEGVQGLGLGGQTIGLYLEQIMSSWSVALLITCVSLSAAAQLLMKGGMVNDAIQRSIASKDSIIKNVIAGINSLLVWCGLSSFGVSALTWLFVLSRNDVSQAYPAVALGIGIVPLDVEIGEAALLALSR